MSVKRKILNLLPDKLYLELMFRKQLGYKLNLNDPKTFNEKLQWLKLYDRKPIYTTMVDKYEAKKYVADKIGEQYIIPTLGVWDNPDEIDFDTLPDQFVLKCNHNSGLGMCICKDKSMLDLEEVRSELRKGLKQNYYLLGREWPYKNVKPRIIAEKYMGDNINDYKIFCFDGNVSIIQVDYDRFKNHKRNIYTTEWEYIDLQIEFKTDRSVIIQKPDKLEEMIDLSKHLSKGFPHLRVDFYIVNNQIKFGELTFYHGSGYERFTPKEWDKKLGDLIILPQKGN